VSRDAVFLCNRQVDLLIISVYLDGVQTILELGTQASAEAITLLSIGFSVIACVLTKVIEGLGILEYCAGTLSESQEFIQFPLHEPFWNMVSSECILKFISSDNVISWEHDNVIVPPKMRRTAKLLHGKVSLICIGTRYCK